MPIYEYRCSSCGHELEALQRLSDAPLLKCPSCNADTLVKLLSAAGFQLKGSGWYATDFKGSGAKPAPKKDAGDSKSDGKGGETAAASGEAKGEAKGGSGSDSKSDSKSESKSEAKSETKTDSKGSGTPSTSGSGAPPSTT
jgi:putative FmdB family regulatory protein